MSDTPSPPKLSSRNLIIEATRCSVGADHEANLWSPYPARVEFLGHLDEPWEGVSLAEAAVVMGAEPPSSDGRTVGSVVQTMPFWTIAIITTRDQFDRLWQLAAAGNCHSLDMHFRPSEKCLLLYGWRLSSPLSESLLKAARASVGL